MMINTPASAYVMNAPGPVSLMTTPEPTNRPAPITPPMAIIVSCRWLSAFFSVGVALMASSDARYKGIMTPSPAVFVAEYERTQKAGHARRVAGLCVRRR